MYRNSEYTMPFFKLTSDENEKNEDNNKREFINESKDSLNEGEDKESLTEDVKIKYFPENDKYAHYVEMVPNPAEMFELVKFGKTWAYIQAPTTTALKKTSDNILYSSNYTYAFRQKDVDLYEATEFVHACLEDNSSRTPETIELFQGDDITEDSKSVGFNVRRGQSILYNAFKSWRNLTLLENSLLLNRLSRSSIVRLINVEVGDMPKEQVGPHLLGIKQLIEQKTAINEGNSLSEYTNPGPIENNVYVPTHNGLGSISTQQVGGDVDVRSIVDIDYFKNRLYGSLKIPKQYLGDTDDATGFNGGTSLSIISSRYAKTVKRIQNTVVQMMNDCINLLLLDKGLDSYINKFELHMVAPVTSEEVDKRDNLDSKIGIVNNIMGLLDGIEDASQRLRILKALLNDIITDQEVLNVLQEEIDKLEKDEEVGIDTTETGDEFQQDMDMPALGNFHEPSGSRGGGDIDLGRGSEPVEGPSDEGGDLPSPDSLGIDMTSMDAEI